jgi:hypothetical protein
MAKILDEHGLDILLKGFMTVFLRKPPLRANSMPK